MHVSEDTQVPPDWVTEWKKTLNHFCNPFWVIKNHALCNPFWVIKNHALSGDNKIKKMSLLKRQVWMDDDDEFDHIVKN